MALIEVNEGISSGAITVSLASVQRWYEEGVFPGLIKCKRHDGQPRLFWDTDVWSNIPNDEVESLPEAAQFEDAFILTLVNSTTRYSTTFLNALNDSRYIYTPDAQDPNKADLVIYCGDRSHVTNLVNLYDIELESEAISYFGRDNINIEIKFYDQLSGNTLVTPPFPGQV